MRGGFQIVVLAPPRGPNERQDENPRERECKWEKQVEDIHGGSFPSLLNVCVPRIEDAKTERELAGIRTAAKRGVTQPAQAAAAPARLYKSEKIKLRRITFIVSLAIVNAWVTGTTPGQEK